MDEELLWAWAAGLVDGEGCFCLTLYRNQNTILPLVSIIMTDKPTLLEIQRIFKAGSITVRAPKAGLKQQYHYTLLGAEIFPIVRRLLPYLRTKSKQAELMIEFGEKCFVGHTGGKKISLDMQILREILREEMQKLNK